jgi:ATP-dependent protease ClpP protease subunit
MQSEVIDLRGSIGEPPNTVEEFTQLWRAKERLGKPIEIQIASVGGFVSDALAMHGLILQSRVSTTARIEFALSAASIVSSAAKHVQIVADGLFMIHSARLTLSGTARQLRKQADEVDRIDSMMSGIYARRTGLPLAAMRAMMDANNGDGTWMTALEAKSNGFVDDVLVDVYAKVSPMIARASFKTEIAKIAACVQGTLDDYQMVLERLQTNEGMSVRDAKREIAIKLPELNARYIREYNFLRGRVA